MQYRDAETLAKWTCVIATLQTSTRKLTHIPEERIPVLYRGVKDLTPEQLQDIQAIPIDTWVTFPTFCTWIPDVKPNDDNFVVPDGSVLFELHAAVDGVELSDISQYPEDGEWLLPMFSSFSVSLIDSFPEKNGLLRVVLQMRGSLSGQLRDNQFPDTARTMVLQCQRQARDTDDAMDIKSLSLTSIICTNLSLSAVKCSLPQHLLHAQYLERFADIHRGSQARQHIEDGTVKWQQCTSEATIGIDGVHRPAAWENVFKRLASTIESQFLKRTRNQKHFTVDNVNLNFKDYLMDAGKGERRIRRMVGRHMTHPLIAAS